MPRILKNSTGQKRNTNEATKNDLSDMPCYIPIEIEVMKSDKPEKHN